MKKYAFERTVTARLLFSLIALLSACGIGTVASAQTRTIRIITYNIEDDINGATTPLPGLIASSGSVTNGGVLEGIGEEIISGDPAQPLDILALQETTSNPTTVTPIVNGLNAFYSSRNVPAGYAMSTYQATEEGGDTADGNGPNALVYNTNTVQLLASVGVGTPTGSGNGEYRQVVRYEFAPAGVTPTTDNEFYIYVSHYKSGTSSSVLTSRGKEAVIIRNDEATNLPANARVLYVGDYNVTTSSEASYQTIVSNTAPDSVQQGQGFDPLNPSGASGVNWSTGPVSNRTDSSTDLRYRDDFEVMTSNVYFDVAGGLAYVAGTYHAFGNPLQTLNTNMPGITASQISQYLTTASDHLPVVADYTIPIPSTAPVASFIGSPTNGVAPLAVTFTDTSTGSVTNWFWDFGDGGTTNVSTNSVVYTYATAGVYSVTEIVSGSGGSSTNAQASYITVLTPFQVWQVQYFGSTTNPAAAANADPDGDGMSNIQEFLAGTDPTNNASALRITSILESGFDVVVTWTTGSGKTNALQYSPGDLSANYSNNFTDIFTVTNTVGTVTNYLDGGAATNASAGYYRVRLVP